MQLQASASTTSLRLDFAAEPLAVRRALEQIVDTLAEEGASSDDQAMAEVLLAEVLNNVVEHAYDRAGGWIEVEAAVTAGGLGQAAFGFTVYDRGRPMPGGMLPDGQLPPVSAADLPEGGFGWHLIRALATGLEHGRAGGRNWLRFTLEAEQKMP